MSCCSPDVDVVIFIVCLQINLPKLLGSSSSGSGQLLRK